MIKGRIVVGSVQTYISPFIIFFLICIDQKYIIEIVRSFELL